MKRLFGIIALATLLFCTANAQTTNTNSNPVVQLPPEVDTAISFLTSASNLIAVAYGTYDSGTGGHYGGGIALAYKIEKVPLFVPFIRGDYLDKQFWMVSGGAEFQVPIRIGGTNGVVLTPFGLAAASTPFSGGGEENGTLQSVTGAGLALSLGKGWHALGDIEWWSAREGNQYRFGFGKEF